MIFYLLSHRESRSIIFHKVFRQVVTAWPWEIAFSYKTCNILYCNSLNLLGQLSMCRGICNLLIWSPLNWSLLYVKSIKFINSYIWNKPFDKTFMLCKGAYIRTELRRTLWMVCVCVRDNHWPLTFRRIVEGVGEGRFGALSVGVTWIRLQILFGHRVISWTWSGWLWNRKQMNSAADHNIFRIKLVIWKQFLM